MVEDLKNLYEKIYDEDSRAFFSFIFYRDAMVIVQSAEWEGRKVLEIGCGEGGLASIIAFHGAEVTAIDYSKEAIKIAEKKYSLENCQFKCCDYRDVSDRFDIVVMQGVLEHTDDPYETLLYIKENLLMNTHSKIITGSPSFLNPRGYIWMTLLLLFDVPMSLSDIHYLCPFDLEKFTKKLEGKLTYKSSDQDLGHGERLLIDLKKRLNNALCDAGMKGNVDRLISWLAKTLPYENHANFSGANIVYTITFDN